MRADKVAREIHDERPAFAGSVLSIALGYLAAIEDVSKAGVPEPELDGFLSAALQAADELADLPSTSRERRDSLHNCTRIIRERSKIDRQKIKLAGYPSPETGETLYRREPSEPWRKDPPMKATELASSMDAVIWAREFCKLNSSADFEMMIGWFANAIMAGYDEAKRRARKEASSVKKECPNCKQQIAYEHLHRDSWMDRAGYVQTRYVCKRSQSATPEKTILRSDALGRVLDFAKESAFLRDGIEDDVDRVLARLLSVEEEAVVREALERFRYPSKQSPATADLESLRNRGLSIYSAIEDLNFALRRLSPKETEADSMISRAIRTLNALVASLPKC